MLTADELILAILAEECAEVIQAIAKVHRFGIHHQNPITREANGRALKNEIGDMLGMVTLIRELKILNISDAEVKEMSDRRITKTLHSIDLSERLNRVGK